MPISVIARQGDTLDALIWREAGLGTSAITRVLEANPGLAACGPVIPHGRKVIVPDIAPTPEPLKLIQLWD